MTSVKGLTVVKGYAWGHPWQAYRQTTKLDEFFAQFNKFKIYVHCNSHLKIEMAKYVDIYHMFKSWKTKYMYNSHDNQI